MANTPEASFDDAIAIIERDSASVTRRSPKFIILEQPASVRFRYLSEPNISKIYGEHSTKSNVTFPTIKIVDYQGKVVVLVSCVTKDKPYRPHPHCLAGDDCSEEGVFQKQVSPGADMMVAFPNLGIQCTKKQDRQKVFQLRQKRNLDPFQNGFPDPDQIDADIVRLCFQVFIQTESNTWRQLQPPLVSRPVIDRKSITDLGICKLSHTSASVKGGQEIMLFCENVKKNDIEIIFSEENCNSKWEERVSIPQSDVHKGCGISFRTPPYRRQDETSDVNVFIQLRKPSNGVVGKPVPFLLYPEESNISRKRRKYEKYDAKHHLSSLLRGQPSTSKLALQGSVDSLTNVSSTGDMQSHFLKRPSLSNMPDQIVQGIPAPASTDMMFLDSFMPRSSPGQTIDQGKNSVHGSPLISWTSSDIQPLNSTASLQVTSTSTEQCHNVSVLTQQYSLSSVDNGSDPGIVHSQPSAEHQQLDVSEELERIMSRVISEREGPSDSRNKETSSIILQALQAANIGPNEKSDLTEEYEENLSGLLSDLTFGILDELNETGEAGTQNVQ